MKNDINGCSTCAIGQESYERFTSPHFKGTRIQYDYRLPDGQLFSVVAKNLKLAREKRDRWLAAGKRTV